MQRRVLVAVLLGALVGLVVGIFLSGTGRMTCDEWQREYAEVARDGEGGVFTFVNHGPIAERLRELERVQPEDCPTPEV